ncbi:DNA topoisomerase large subunit [Paraglaciecola Antarctic GD virus 1]|nr:DNA topoisomerase large subunit [Paraglaciecola Antarctic GD virus 1]
MTDFKVLTDKEHCLTRPNMYIGSIDEEMIEQFVFGKYQSVAYVAGLAKIMNEVIDNSVDEAIRTNFKHANIINVEVSNSDVLVADNGRGIPQDLITDIDGSKILRPIAAWTRTKSGSNFNDDGRTTIGLNGVGSALTNFFSTQFVGDTYDGKRRTKVTCLNNADGIKSISEDSDQPSGTTVTFVPDFERFGVNDISEDLQNIIHDRVQSLQICYPKIAFKFNNKRVEHRNINQYRTLYSEQTVIFKSDNCSFFLFNSDGYKQNSFVNGVQTKSGGSHTQYILGQIMDSMIPLIKKKFKIDIPKSIINVNLGLVVFLTNFVNPKFDSQTKEKLTNTPFEVKTNIGDVDFEGIAKSIVNCDAMISPIVDAILAKKIAADLRAAAAEQKKLGKKKVAGHIKANGNKDTTLFLTEGMSASGFFINVRDSKCHGLFPLRGKVLNTRNLKPVEVLKNNELSSIMSILGLQYGKRCILPHYDSIAIMVDADTDGLGSIYPLLLNFFSEWPELFEEKRIKFIRTPVVIATKGKIVKWFYNIPSYNKAKLDNYKIRYIKGLGSLEISEYKEIIHNPQYDIIELDSIDKLEMLFDKDNVQARKDWML